MITRQRTRRLNKVSLYKKVKMKKRLLSQFGFCRICDILKQKLPLNKCDMVIVSCYIFPLIITILVCVFILLMSLLHFLVITIANVVCGLC